jgi:UDP-N-acetylmuramoyl-L-alanyl-D-glutamate--2,6-diaminopimelate ligase
VDITGLSTDSRCVAPGNLFIARKGGSFDGAAGIPEALRGGAAAIATDLCDPTCPVSQIIAPNPGALEARLASRFYGAPSKELYLVGITGTKGKTTTSYLVRHLLEKLGIETGLIGTIESRIGQEKRASSFTTHFPIQNQKLLREMALKGCRGAVLEVSSHGLSQGRVEEIHFDAAIFTSSIKAPKNKKER